MAAARASGRVFPPDRMITQRRQEEEQRETYVQKVKNEQKDKQFAHWVNWTHDKIQFNKKLQVIDTMQAQQQATLTERRERLAALLAAEQAEYFKALDNMVETQDQRKERLATMAMELKQEREAKRSSLAKSKLEQAFRENCEPLRAALTKQNTLQVSADRAQQILWAEARRHEEEEDSKVFDEMWEQERLKKVQRAKDDLERVRKMNEDLRKNLKEQKDAYTHLKLREKEIMAEEDRIYKEQIQLQLQIEAQKDRERRAEMIANGFANREFNVRLRKEKEKERLKLKHEDMRQLQELLDYIKEEEDNDQRLKVARREETKKYMEGLREQMGQDAENEAEMERLWQLENEKAWNQREAKWKIEQEQRDNLLREVFEERALQLQLKRGHILDKAALQKAERERILEEMEALTLIEGQRNEDRRLAAKEAQSQLQQQIDMRAAARQNARLEAAMEKQASEMAEAEFKSKVQRELDAVTSRWPGRQSAGYGGGRPF